MAYTWRNGADAGGGYANAIALSPVVPDLYFLAGDTWDLHYSTNGGDLWQPCNWGAADHYDTYGRAAAWSTKYPSRCYVSTGGSPQFPGRGGFVKVEGFQFHYQNTAYGSDPAGTDQTSFPRACGDFIQLDYDSGTGTEWIYALTNQGLARSTDEGVSWTLIGGKAFWQAAYGITSGNPAYADLLLVDSDTLLVATYRNPPSSRSGGNVYLVTGIRTAGPATVPTRCTNAPGAVEDLALVGSSVYAAAATGVYLVTGAAYNTWTLVAGSSAITGGATARSPQSIDGFDDGSGGPTLYVGTGPVAAGTHTGPTGRNVAKSTDGGATWSFPCAGAAIHYDVLGQPPGNLWWLHNGGLAQLDNPNFNVQAIKVDPFDHNKITLCGRAGTHQSRDGGATWHPAGNGACGGSALSMQAGAGGEAWRQDMDYGGCHTKDHFDSIFDRAYSGTTAQNVKTVTRNGHTYTFDDTVVPRTIKLDGVSIADDFFRAGATNLRSMDVSTDVTPGFVYIGLGAGGLLIGDPGAVFQPAALTSVTVTGSPQVGATLTVHETVTGVPTPTVTRQWQRSAAPTGPWTGFGGGATTQLLGTSEQGLYVRCVSTATNTGGSATLASTATPQITAAPVAPSFTVPPAITGSGVIGSVLTVDNGTVAGSPPITYTYQWVKRAVGAVVWTTDPGSTANTLDLTGRTDLIGLEVSARVTATNSVAATTGQANTVVVQDTPATAPANTTPPLVNLLGLAAPLVGTQIKGDDGVWTGTQPMTPARQWHQSPNLDGSGSSIIPGATLQTYTPQSSDVGKTLLYSVTMTNTAGSAGPVTSPPTPRVAGVAPTITNLAVTGQPMVGQTLTASETVTGTPTPLVTRQWQRSPSAAGPWTGFGGSAATQLLGTTEQGLYIRVVDTATNAAGAVTQASTAVGPVAAIPTAPRFTVLPVVSGTGVVGDSLSVDHGTVTGDAPITYTYQWVTRPSGGAWAADPGSTANTLSLVARDDLAGLEVSCRVTATNSVSAQMAQASNSVLVHEPPPVAPVNTRLPAVILPTGRLQPGKTVKADDGDWTGTQPMTVARQWYRCKSDGSSPVAITGQTGASYLVRSADVGHTLRVGVTMTNIAG